MKTFTQYMKDNKFEGYTEEYCKEVTELYIKYQIRKLEENEPYAKTTINQLHQALIAIE